MTTELARLRGRDSSNAEVAPRENGLPSDREPKGEWNQLYFKEPFTLEDSLTLLSDCVEEALKSGVLDGSNTCSVERVVTNKEDPTQGWQALRLTSKGVRAVSFRTCVINCLKPRQLPVDQVTTV